MGKSKTLGELLAERGAIATPNPKGRVMLLCPLDSDILDIEIPSGEINSCTEQKGGYVVTKWLACPFCGSEDIIIINSEDEESPIFYMGECVDCQAEGPPGLIEEDAIKKWNERVKS